MKRMIERKTFRQTFFSFEKDLTSNAQDFRHQSGLYELSLIIGDALLENSLTWKLNDALQLTFHDDGQSDKDFSDLYRPRKEIIHQFREEEKRPPAIVSTVFSGLTVLPLFILLILVKRQNSNRIRHLKIFSFSVD